MLLTIDQLNINFNENIEEMKLKLAELERLEKAITESAHFKLLAGKTQMIGRKKGLIKKERSRLKHTTNIADEVVQKTIEKIYIKILANNPDLASSEYKEIFELNKQIDIKRGLIMAKAHDIGHVAFGHEGERAINKFMSKIKNPIEKKAILAQNLKYFGKEYERNQGHIVDEEDFSFKLPALSFEHNELSAIIFNEIVEKEKINLTAEEIKKLTIGILGHSTSRTPITLLKDDIIAQIVRVADKVEYINKDFDERKDALKVDFFYESELLKYFQKSFDDRVAETTTDLANELFRTGEITEDHTTMRRLRRGRAAYEDMIYLYDDTFSRKILKDLLKISDDPQAMREYYNEHTGTEALYPSECIQAIKADYELIKKLNNKTDIEPEEALMLDDAYERISTETLFFKSALQGENSDRIYFMTERVLNYYYTHPEKIPTGRVEGKITPIDIVKSDQFSYELNSNQTNLQRLREYISLMDDETFEKEYDRLVNERIEKGRDYGVEPVTMEEIKIYLRERIDEEVHKSIIKHKRGTRNYEEGKTLYREKSEEYYSEKITEKGKETIEELYRRRLKEYQKDYESLQRMYEADERREKEVHQQEEVSCVKENSEVTEKINEKEEKIKEGHTHVD